MVAKLLQLLTALHLGAEWLIELKDDETHTVHVTLKPEDTWKMPPSDNTSPSLNIPHKSILMKTCLMQQCHCTSRRNPMIKFGLKKLNHVYLKNIFNDYGLCTESKLDFHHCLSSPMLERQAFSVSKSCE